MSEDLKVRLRGGILAAIIVSAVILTGRSELVFLVAIAAAMWGWREYARMMQFKNNPLFYYPGFILLLLSLTYAFFLKPQSYFWIWLSWIVGFVLLYVEAHLKNELATFDVQKGWSQFIRFVLGQKYIFLLFGFVSPISDGPHGEKVLFFALLLVFSTDIGAYFAGKRWGRRKIWPALSPSKTVEGALGGWALSFVVALSYWAVMHALHPNSLPLLTCVIAACIGAPLSQAGDLLESLMKRATGCKDSGSLIPGHGGILDRTDGFVFVMPVIYFLFA